LAPISGSTNTTWIQYTYSYTATKTAPILIFGFDSYNIVYIVVDDVSVVDTSNASVELLVNPSFENSTSIATGWTTWCTTSCTAGAGTIATTNCRTGNCFKDLCSGGGVDYIGQAFAATIGHIYNISFWSQRVKVPGSGTTVTLYTGIV
jgi:hypothetical protein